MSNKFHDPKGIRVRIEYEDQLLASRTNIFLVANGLGAVAVGMENAPGLGIWWALFAVNALWILTGILSSCAVVSAGNYYREEKQAGRVCDPTDDRIRDALAWTHPALKCTYIQGIYLPMIVTSIWAIAGIFALIQESPG